MPLGLAGAGGRSRPSSLDPRGRPAQHRVRARPLWNRSLMRMGPSVRSIGSRGTLHLWECFSKRAAWGQLMGYDVHITRSEWLYAEEQPGHVTLDEWRRVAEADPEFVKEGNRYRWTVSDWSFCFTPGRVYVKSPDDPTFR